MRKLIEVLRNGGGKRLYLLLLCPVDASAPHLYRETTVAGTPAYLAVGQVQRIA
jgi:hypothetical protein